MKKSIVWMAMGAMVAMVAFPLWAEQVEVETTVETWYEKTEVTKIVETKKMKPQESYRTLIVVNNLAGKEYKGDVKKFENRVVSAINKSVNNADRLRIISSDNVLADGEALAKSSIINLAENLGADLVFLVSLDEINENNVNGRYDYTLEGSYQMLDVYDFGAAIPGLGDSFEKKKSFRTQNKSALTELQTGVADDIAKDIKKNAGRIATRKDDSFAMLTVSAIAQDMTGNSLTLPVFCADEEGGQIYVEDLPLEIALVGAVVYLDGFAVGTTPLKDPVEVRRGAHKLRITCPGFEPFESDISVKGKGLEMPNVSLRMSKEGLERWKGMQAFVNDLSKDQKRLNAFLRRDEKITDAETELIRGKAEMYSNSYFQIEKLPETLVIGDTHHRPHDNQIFNILNNINVSK